MMMCKIISPKTTTIYKNIKSVLLPTVIGQTQVLSNHAESFIVLQKGDISLQRLNNTDKIIGIIGGECYVKKNIITIIL